MNSLHFFKMGFKAMLPVVTGVIPFGAVVGTVSAEAHLSFFQTMMMNLFVYAGASQLAAVDLMHQHAASAVVIATGLIINLRFLLYSAALSSLLEKSSLITKLSAAHSITDQSYATMSANEYRLKDRSETLPFYFGTAICMFCVWHLSVISGFIFGNFAPVAWSLDYAVPLSFLSLTVPTLKNKKYVMVAMFSAALSILFYQLPYKLGLVATALSAIGLAAFLTRKKVSL